MAELPEGCFPRMNASLMRQGSYVDRLVSVVGKFEGNDTFRCCDGGTITVPDVPFDPEEFGKDMVVEIMGQTIDQNTITVRLSLPLLNCQYCVTETHLTRNHAPSLLPYHIFVLQAFIARPLSKDTDLALYNKMIEIQHNPKFAQFFNRQQ